MNVNLCRCKGFGLKFIIDIMDSAKEKHNSFWISWFSFIFALVQIQRQTKSRQKTTTSRQSIIWQICRKIKRSMSIFQYCLNVEQNAAIVVPFSWLLLSLCRAFHFNFVKGVVKNQFHSLSKCRCKTNFRAVICCCCYCCKILSNFDKMSVQRSKTNLMA